MTKTRAAAMIFFLALGVGLGVATNEEAKEPLRVDVEDQFIGEGKAGDMFFGEPSGATDGEIGTITIAEAGLSTGAFFTFPDYAGHDFGETDPESLKVVNKKQEIVFTIHKDCDGHLGDVVGWCPDKEAK